MFATGLSPSLTTAAARRPVRRSLGEGGTQYCPRQDKARPCHPTAFAAFRSSQETFALNHKCSRGLRNAILIFNSLRTLPPAQKFQHHYFQSLPHALKNEQNITPTFLITSPLFVRSCAQVRKLTPLFSCIPALFGKTTGEGVGVRTKSNGAAIRTSGKDPDPRRGQGFARSLRQLATRIHVSTRPGSPRTCS